MIRCRDYPIVSGSEWRPLHIDNQPWLARASQTPWRAVWRIQVNNCKPFGTKRGLLVAITKRFDALPTHDARAISRPEGEIVAEPTTPSTWIEPSDSKLSLSYADFTIRPFLGESTGLSNAGIVLCDLLKIGCVSHVAAHLRALVAVFVQAEMTVV